MQLESAPPQRFLFIDALRGLAAMSVVCFHAYEGGHLDALSQHLPAPVLALFQHGDLGVQVFFVLSGFVIAHSLARRAISGRFVAAFMLRRSIRLDPPYWASMLLVMALGVLSTRFVPGKVYELPSAEDLLLHVLYLPDLLQRPLLNSVYWTLCLEIQFYVVFALLMWLVARLHAHGRSERRAWLWLMVLATFLADVEMLELLPSLPGLFLRHWALFLTGVWVWRCATHPAESSTTWLGCSQLLLLAVCAALKGNPAFAVGSCSGAAILLAARTGNLGRWLRAKPFQLLGLVSYSLYLTHNPISGAAFRVAYKLTGQTPWLEAGWLIVVLALCVGFAWMFYLVIERPSHELSRRLKLRRSVQVSTPRLSHPSVS